MHGRSQEVESEDGWRERGGRWDERREKGNGTVIFIVMK